MLFHYKIYLSLIFFYIFIYTIWIITRRKTWHDPQNMVKLGVGWIVGPIAMKRKFLKRGIGFGFGKKGENHSHGLHMGDFKVWSCDER